MANNILKSSEVINKPLNYERYRDIENELEKENLIEFIKYSCNEQKQSLKKSVSFVTFKTFLVIFILYLRFTYFSSLTI